jgi:hypothetical protein
VVSRKQYPPTSPEDDFIRTANSIFLNILAANPWLQRFYPVTLRPGSYNHHKAKNLTERYPYFRGLNFMPLNPNVKICTHIKVTGIRCGSPALRGENFCYFHQRMIRGVPTPSKARIHPMALIENEEAIQVALMETINAIVRNQIDLKRANLLLRALSIAVRNSRRVRFDRCESEMIRKLPESAETQPAALPKDASPASTTEAETRTAEVQVWDQQWDQKKEAEAQRKPSARVAPRAIAQQQAAKAYPLREGVELRTEN